MTVGKHHPKHPDFLIHRLAEKKAWRLKVPYEDEKGEIRYKQREFSDAVFGGKNQALKLLRQERDTYLSWPPFRKYYDARLAPAKEHVARLNRVSNKTHVVGVNLIEHYRGERANFYFRAQLGDDIREQYSLRELGAQEAFRQAVLKRYEWLLIAPPSDDEINIMFRKWLLDWEDILNAQEIGIYTAVSSVPRWQQMSPEQLKKVLPQKPAGKKESAARLDKPKVKGLSVRVEERKRGSAAFFVVLENNRIKARINWDKGLSTAFTEAMIMLAGINGDPELIKLENLRLIFGKWVGTSRHAMEQAELDMNPDAFYQADKSLPDID